MAAAGVRRILSVQDIGHQYLAFTLELVRRERLNRAENPCNPDIGYKFSRCIKQSISDTIGCKLPWDKHTEGFIVGNRVMFHCVLIIFCFLRTQSLFFKRPIQPVWDQILWNCSNGPGLSWGPNWMSFPMHLLSVQVDGHRFKGLKPVWRISCLRVFE